ncbi:MAG: hypothetical protein A2Z47_04190 [Thermodesulfovibrio sp. RBG_19FT_COMBO_42_12]|nr:MAG: hypothetical protein A2Z47_04190 [Thermodesulfovibrio sp. RBG_19FT_COMBO_42_12]
MSVMSPQIGEFLIKATHLPDIDAALKKVLTEKKDKIHPYVIQNPRICGGEPIMAVNSREILKEALTLPFNES